MMKEISYKELAVDPMTIFGEEWFALAAGNEKDGANTMTIIWGHMGALWERGSHATMYIHYDGYPTCIKHRQPDTLYKLYHSFQYNVNILFSAGQIQRILAGQIPPAADIIRYRTVFPAHGKAIPGPQFFCRAFFSRHINLYGEQNYSC